MFVETPRADAADLLVCPWLMREATRRSAAVREAHPVVGAVAAADHLARRAPALRIAPCTLSRKALAPMWWYSSQARSSCVSASER